VLNGVVRGRAGDGVEPKDAAGTAFLRVGGVLNGVVRARAGDGVGAVLTAMFVD